MGISPLPAQVIQHIHGVFPLTTACIYNVKEIAITLRRTACNFRCHEIVKSLIQKIGARLDHQLVIPVALAAGGGREQVHIAAFGTVKAVVFLAAVGLQFQRQRQTADGADQLRHCNLSLQQDPPLLRRVLRCITSSRER